MAGWTKSLPVWLTDALDDLLLDFGQRPTAYLIGFFVAFLPLFLAASGLSWMLIKEMDKKDARKGTPILATSWLSALSGASFCPVVFLLSFWSS